MKNRKVAIIGGGIGGLTALDELAKYPGMEPRLYEASDRVGGRIRTGTYDGEKIEVGASYFHKYYHGLWNPIDEFGFGERKKPYPEERAGFLKDGNVIPVCASGLLGSLLKGSVSWKDIRSLRGLERKAKELAKEGNKALKHYYDSDVLDFADVLKGFPITEKGYKTSFSEFAGTLTPAIREKFVDPFIRCTVFAGHEKVNEATGKAILASAISRLYTFEGGMETLPKAMHEKNKDMISLETPVTKIEKTGKGYDIITPEGEREFDFVIAAVPLSKLPGMIEGFAGDVEYSRDIRMIVKGNLRDRYGKMDSLLIGEGDAGMVCISRDAKNLFDVCATRENPDFGDFFSDYEIKDRIVWEDAIPIIGSAGQIPRLEAGENFYLAGDFPLPCMEMSVDTGKKVAREILRK